MNQQMGFRNSRDKLNQEAAMFVTEPDATIAVPLMSSALLECKRAPDAADALIAKATR